MSRDDCAASVPPCTNCDRSIAGTPWAFPLDDMRFDARIRFCSEPCLRAYEDEVEQGLASVCPGCHAVGGEPCLPGCIDDEIERERSEAYLSGNYDCFDEEGDDGAL